MLSCVSRFLCIDYSGETANTISAQIMKVVASYELGTKLDYQQVTQIQNLEVCNKGVMKI